MRHTRCSTIFDYLRAQRSPGGFCAFLGVLILGVGAYTPVFAADGRHALLIGISRYAPEFHASSLDGVPFDLQNARLMAKAMGVDDSAIIELKDSVATKANIEARLGQLSRKVEQGDRVFVYFSGHGTRRLTPAGCEEGLLTYDAQVINEKELAAFTGPMSRRAEKLVTMIDACFSGGVLSATRSLVPPPGFVAKFAGNGSQETCSIQGVNNLSTRSLLTELARFGIKSENFVQIAAARRDEVSWDEPGKGGTATQAISQCLLGEAQDLNQSGAVSLDEVRNCAQKIMDKKLAPVRARGFLPSTIQVSGNRNLIVAPSVVIRPPAATSAMTQTGESANSTQTASNPTPPPPVVTPPAVSQQPTVVQPEASKPPSATQIASNPTRPLPVVTPPTVAQQPTVLQPEPPKPPIETQPVHAGPVVSEPIGALATMYEIYQQRDPRRTLGVWLPAKELRIGQDKLSMTVKSDVAGYVYVVLLGSDEKSFYLLFPNKIDKDNRIRPNQAVRLPRRSWQITAGGPEGTDRLLVVVSQSPRNAKVFISDESSGGGTFTFAVADLQNRHRLIDFFVGKGVNGRSIAMSAELLEIKEIP